MGGTVVTNKYGDWSNPVVQFWTQKKKIVRSWLMIYNSLFYLYKKYKKTLRNAVLSLFFLQDMPFHHEKNAEITC